MELGYLLYYKCMFYAVFCSYVELYLWPLGNFDSVLYMLADSNSTWICCDINVPHFVQKSVLFLRIQFSSSYVSIAYFLFAYLDKKHCRGQHRCEVVC